MGKHDKRKPTIWDDLKGIFGPLQTEFSEAELHQIASDSLMHAIESCRVCKGSLSHHSFYHVGICPSTGPNSSSIEKFVSAFRERQWDKIAQFDYFDPMNDALSVYAIRCADLSIHAVLIEDPYEMFYPRRLVEHIIPGRGSANDLMKVLSTRGWREFLD